MIYPAILARKYEWYRPFLENAASTVKETLINFCEVQGYAFVSRFKTIESLAEKIETGRFRAWSEIDDLFACTIVVPTLTEEKQVVDFCEATFAANVKRRGQMKKAPDSFVFDSTRVQAQLKRPEGLDAVNVLSIYDIQFEIQIRSAFEHAWAVTTHSLAYKSSEIDWKRLRLAAQIKAAVEQLDSLIVSFEQTSSAIAESKWPEVQRKKKIASTVTNLIRSGKIPQELAPENLSRFCDNVYELLSKTIADGELSADVLDSALRVLNSELNRISPKLIPRSVSLLQFFFATFVQQQVIHPPFGSYVCHVTPELLSLYPELTEVEPIFDYQT